MSTNPLARRAGRIAVVFAAASLAVLATAGVAAAHVTARVIGEPAAQGGYTKITFRVPNEDSTAGTVKLEVKFPTDTPIASLSTKAVPGWTATVSRTKLATPIKTDDAEISEAVSVVTWTANPGVRIAPGEFAEFEVSGGPMPETDTLVLPTVQTYDSGKVVSWIDKPAAGTEPEHPAPTVALTKAAAKTDNATGQSDQPVSNAASTTSTGSGTDNTARWLAGIGLVVGALGLGFGAGAILRGRRAPAAVKEGDGS
ncbi:MAG: YcnI family protein [Labedaea sp.]